MGVWGYPHGDTKSSVGGTVKFQTRRTTDAGYFVRLVNRYEDTIAGPFALGDELPTSSRVVEVLKDAVMSNELKKIT